MFKMENEQEKDLISTKVDDLLDLVKDQNLYFKKFTSINFEFVEETYFFYLKNCVYIIFNKKIIVRVLKPNKMPINTDIRTNIELTNFLSQNNININHVVVFGKENNKKLSECLYCINFYIKNNILKCKKLKALPWTMKNFLEEFMYQGKIMTTKQEQSLQLPLMFE